MTNEFNQIAERLLADPTAAGIRVTTHYTSAIGPTVTPPAGTLRILGDRPVDVHGEFELPDGRQAVTLDSWGSQASRMEASAEALAEQIGFPLVRFLDKNGQLLTTSVRLSHRHADATWRAARKELEAVGVPFADIQNATVSHADPLLRWFPTAPLFGWWHSHITNEKKHATLAATLGSDVADAVAGYARLHEDSRSARVITAEIIAKGVHRRQRMAARSDSLFGPLKSITGIRKGSIKPSELGLGSLPPVDEKKAPVDVTYEDIQGNWFLSLAGLRRYGYDTIDRTDAGSLLMALGLLLRETAQQESRLRAGTELAVSAPGPRAEILWHGDQDEPIELPSHDELCQIVRTLGEKVGWRGPLDVTFASDSVLLKLLGGANREEPGDN